MISSLERLKLGVKNPPVAVDHAFHSYPNTPGLAFRKRMEKNDARQIEDFAVDLVDGSSSPGSSRGLADQNRFRFLFPEYLESV
jgi:hypothetical protein